MRTSFITDYKKLFNDIVDFTVDYIKSNNLQSAILGISGGIDSTVVAAILYEASRKLNVNKGEYFKFYGYSLPTDTTNKDEFYASNLVGNSFADEFEVHNIDNIATKIHEDFGISFDNDCLLGKETCFRRGNVKARLRMSYLYDRAKAHRGLVVGTDNWTEKLLGFSTIGGDDTADYMPLQNLWKTEVYGIAKYLLEMYKNQNAFDKAHAMQASIELAPQDGLGISNSDMEQIGAENYYDVDEILVKFEKYQWYINMGGDVSDKKRDEYFSDLIEKFGKSVCNNVIRRRTNNFKLNLPLEFVFDDGEYTDI